ncbi:3'-5' RNA helicase YTHDC2-like [Anopheles darlingi]|uniref:3'-5' RNA helicase YTHDC2-like n=1 Tax=Anopheles darlingi TaxID=43151 RepID=UPI0020FFF8C9|nr:3'-5' RNA helicase YTHDC2-like [Anopheles darlingi]
MASKNTKINVKIEEDIRIFIHRQIDLFLQDEQQSEYDFPATLTNQHRAYIHEYVKNKRIKSRSHGKGNARYLTIYKTNLSAITHDDARLELTDQTIAMITELQNIYRPKGNQSKAKNKRNMGRYNVYLTASQPSVPPPVHSAARVFEERSRLPIAQFHDIILKCMLQNQVIIISGNTGSGKTTQVPQFVMEAACQSGTPCRVICTQPRRISAVTVAERVCFERNEQLGDAVGYQIRLESRLKPNTNLLFCTNGVLLRCLTGQGAHRFLDNVTHIIIDEVHERDQYSDFLLIALKDNLPKHPHLKVVLMSATIESNTFSQYFNNCPVIEIPGRLFSIERYYLEDILFQLDTYNHTVKDVKAKILSNIEHQRTSSDANGRQHSSATANMDDESILLMNDILEECWIENSPEPFQNFFTLVQEESISVDFQHTETKMTALMIAAAKGYVDILKSLLDMGADPSIREKHNYTAHDWACFIHGNSVCSQLLANAKKRGESQPVQQMPALTPNIAKQLLDAYHTSFGDERIDHNLIIDVIQYICKNQPEGGILVFLPGFEDIQESYELLTKRVAPHQRLKLFMLHSKMQTSDQHAVFNPVPVGVRKIVLSTNIAETSITMDDVVYVIDSGKVKQKYYDSVTATNSLMATWISQACATQRAGRAGRTKPGICYRLFSRARLEAMDQFTLPEIMRVPLTEICLNTALLTQGASILDFLNRAIQPPAATSVKQSIKYLQKVGALDDDENLTDLGHILADLPVDARLGKMLLYGILLKCYEPVLLIVSVLSINDIFLLPGFAGDKEKSRKARRELAEESYSDCFCLLRAYQRWYEARSISKRKEICNRFFLSHSKLTMVCELRDKLHGHLCSIGLIKSYGPGSSDDLNQFAANWSMVKACLVVGLYPNICHLERYSKAMKARFEKKIFVHPSSVLADAKKPNGKDAKLWLPTEWITFEEKFKSSRGSMIRCNTVVTSLAISIFAGPLYFDEEESLVECDDQDETALIGGCKIAIDDWINFIVDTPVAKAVLRTRQLLSELFLKFTQNPRTFQLTAMEYRFLQTLGQLLTLEDGAAQLTNRVEIGTTGANSRKGYHKPQQHDQWRVLRREEANNSWRHNARSGAS